MNDRSSLIPIIDVSGLFGDELSARSAIDRAIGEACQSFGCFMAVGLPVDMRPDPARMKALFTLFDLPAHVLYEIGSKLFNPSSERSYRGYRVNERGNQYYDIGPEPPVSGPAIKDIERLIEPNAWPPEDLVPGWQELMIAYFRSMEECSKLIIGSLARFIDVSETAAVKRYVDSNSTLRLLNYPTRDEDALLTEIGGTHTDNCGLSLLWQDAPGLQMQTPSGEWHEVPELEGALSVHLGEALEKQASGRVRATPHRVLGHGVERHSIAFFLEPGLYGSVRPFSVEAFEADARLEDTYAASLIETLRKTGRV